MTQDIGRAAIEIPGGNDVAALAHQGRHAQVKSGHTAGGCHRTHATLERRRPFLEDRGCGVRDARVDVARSLEIEQARSMIGVVEHERCRPVDRHGSGAGVGVGLVAGMQAERVEAKEIRFDHPPSVPADGIGAEIDLAVDFCCEDRSLSQERGARPLCLLGLRSELSSLGCRIESPLPALQPCRSSRDGRTSSRPAGHHRRKPFESLRPRSRR